MCWCQSSPPSVELNFSKIQCSLLVSLFTFHAPQVFILYLAGSLPLSPAQVLQTLKMFAILFLIHFSLVITGILSLEVSSWYFPAQSMMPHRSGWPNKILGQRHQICFCYLFCCTLTIHLFAFSLSPHSCNIYCRLRDIKQWLII